MSAPAPLLTILSAEATVIGALAAMFAAVAWRTRDRGLGWLVAGFALAALWYGKSDRIPETGPFIDTPLQRLGAVVIGSAVLCVSAGVVRYLGLPAGRLRWAVLACGLPGLAQVAWLAAGGTLSHASFHVGVLAAYLGAAGLALRRGVTDPGDGHLVLGLALLSLPAMPFVMGAFGLPPDQLKYFAGLSLALFGLVLLTVTLLRGHRQLQHENARRAAAEAALRDANARLEARVHERTSHLHELIAGLESFNRGVSHDLRSPLAGMASLARLAAEALDRADDSLARRALPAIAAQCEASMEMVDTMLELARIGEAPPRREPVDVASLARAAFDEVLLGQAGATAPRLDCPAALQVLADAGLLRRVFVNLIGNAVKFSRAAPQPRVEVQAMTDGHDVTVRVRDNGIGFDPAQAERLFEPFFRAHPHSHEGHGLGLSIVRRAVEAMGGRVWAEGAPGAGAALCFTLPGAAA